MTKRTLILTDDDDPPWSGIRPPTDRMRDHLRYLRGELGFVMCRQFADADCVVTQCPLGEDLTITICRRGDCDNVALKCSEGHRSAEILEAILDQIRRG
jgi:hypothetical protein